MARSGGGETGEAQFTLFYQRHYPAVERYVRRRVAEPNVADIVIETFAIAWRRFDELDDDALPWLYAVAMNLIRNQLRKTGREAGAILRSEPSEIADGEDVERRVLDGAAVRQAFDELRENDREVLRLVAWEGLSHAQAAQALGCSINAVGLRIHRARQRLDVELDRLANPIAPNDPAPEES